MILGGRIRNGKSGYMDLEKFEFIKEEYGHCASWAIWEEVGATPKSNAGDLNILDPKKNTDLLSQLKPNVVFVGLNTSGNVEDKEPFSNFHPTGPHANDFKIRFALKGTEYWGGYMTDIIKGHVQKDSKKVLKYLKKHRKEEIKNIKKFRKELKDLGTKNPTIIAFGNAAYRILKRNLKDEYTIIKVYHYSHRINKENYSEHFQSETTSKSDKGNNKGGMSSQNQIHQFLNNLSNEKLISVYPTLMEILKDRKIITTNNLTGELGEYLAIKFYNETKGLPKLQKAPPGTRNIDAISINGERYSIKTSRTNRTGVFHSITEGVTAFEYLLLVILDENFKTKEIYECTWETFVKFRKIKKPENKYSIQITESFKKECRVFK